MRGVRCTVVDPRYAGGGATQASAGMLAPYVEAHAGGPMLDLCVRSLDLYDAWIADIRRDAVALGGRDDIELPEVRQDRHPRDRALAGARGGTARGPRRLDGAFGGGDLVPPLAATAGALRNERHGYVDARQLTDALAESAESRGVTFISARAERIDRRGGTLTVDLGPGHSALEADAVVLAAGAWTNRILGVRTPPVRPVRGQLLLHWGDIDRIPAILWGPDCYIVPRRHPLHLVIGATVEDAGFDERPTEDGTNRCSRRRAGCSRRWRRMPFAKFESDCAPPRPTSYPCSATIRPSLASSTRQATTATASCSHRSRRS
jgi:glycine/D-amino acid oxidase-like deaminating enzyme